jgi:hypothetical protein
LSDQSITDEQRRGLDTVEKLLRLAGKNSNEHEAAAATAKAMAMLADLNLTLASVDESGEGGGRRAEEKLVGGFYEFERDLWASIAELNFCLCWHQKSWVKRPPTNARKAQMIQDPFRRTHILRGQFKVIGRMHNIAATRGMTEYLLGTIERLTRQRLHEDGVTEKVNTQLRSRWAVSFREGIAERIAEKLWDRRQEQIADERRAAREAEERRGREADMAGASTETAITLSSLRKTEEYANIDFVMGEGWSAERRYKRAEAARREKEAREEYTRWAAAHPEEAKKQEEERRKAERKRSSRSYGSAPREKERDWGAYRAGREVGESVGIDRQAPERKVAGALA